jgi:hypothetical protein
MANRKGLFLSLLVFIFAGAIAHAGTLTPTYSSAITPGGVKGGLGTVKSGGTSVTIDPNSIVAVSDGATTAVGSITWTPSTPMNVTLTFKYQITSPGAGFVMWGGDWFSGKFEYTDGKEKTFSQTFDVVEQVSVSVQVKNGSVSISNISVP